MIKDFNSLYSKINIIIKDLKNNNDELYKESLLFALSGSTSGEILGALLLSLKNLKENGGRYLSINNVKLVNKLIETINNVLSNL